MKHVRPKKHLGQHFLTDHNISKKIAESITGEGYSEVLEIGPGTGMLTQYLLENQDQTLWVSELDRDSVAYLQEHFPKLENRILEGDFLRMNLQKQFSGQFAVIGNFPYNISSQILFKVLDNRDQIPEVSGMFQKEVAERVVAEHGNKTYGILSVLLQAFYECEYLFTVSEKVFNPPPKVKSAVIRLRRRENPAVENQSLLFEIVKSAFNQRRKTMRNSLKAVRNKYGIESTSFDSLRPEQLSVNQFIQLYNEVLEAC